MQNDLYSIHSLPETNGPRKWLQAVFSLLSELSIAVNFRHAICIMHHFQVCCKVMERPNYSRFELLQVNMKGCTIQLLRRYRSPLFGNWAARCIARIFPNMYLLFVFYTSHVHIKRFRPSVYTPTFIWSRYWKTREAKPTCLYLYSSGLYVRYVRHICVKTEYSAVILFLLLLSLFF